MRRNVLITAASRRVPLVDAFQRVLRETGGRVIVTDVNAMSPAVHVADAAFRVPMATEAGYVESLEALCESHDIALLVPTIDDELEVIAAARPRFEAAGVKVAVSTVLTTAICNDKLRTAQVLRASGIPAAESWLPADVPADVAFPLFLKPRNGRGGVGAHMARNRKEFEFFAEYVDRPVVQEYLDGPEFTIDMLCHEGQPLAIVPRERVVIRAGVMDRGRTVRSRSLLDLGLACAAALEFHGPVNIQCRMVGGVPTVFEINPRFSGGIPLTIEAGANFPRMLLDLARGKAVEPRIGHFTAGLWMTSYEAAIFLQADEASVFPRSAAPIRVVA